MMGEELYSKYLNVFSNIFKNDLTNYFGGTVLNEVCELISDLSVLNATQTSYFSKECTAYRKNTSLSTMRLSWLLTSIDFLLGIDRFVLCYIDCCIKFC